MITCEFENGNKASLRHVSCDGIVIKDGKVLLGKRAEHLSNGGKFGLIGGYLDRDETTLEGMAREVLEETGLEAISLTLFRINTNPYRKGEDRQNIQFVYIVEVGDKVSERDDEMKELIWFELEKIPAEDEWAFDHYENVLLYREYVRSPYALPKLD